MTSKRVMAGRVGSKPNSFSAKMTWAEEETGKSSVRPWTKAKTMIAIKLTERLLYPGRLGRLLPGGGQQGFLSPLGGGMGEEGAGNVVTVQDHVSVVNFTGTILVEALDGVLNAGNIVGIVRSRPALRGSGARTHVRH